MAAYKTWAALTSLLKDGATTKLGCSFRLDRTCMTIGRENPLVAGTEPSPQRGHPVDLTCSGAALAPCRCSPTGERALAVTQRGRPNSGPGWKSPVATSPWRFICAIGDRWWTPAKERSDRPVQASKGQHPAAVVGTRFAGQSLPGAKQGAPELLEQGHRTTHTQLARCHPN